MPVASFSFLLFVLVLTIVYYLIPSRYRWIVLLVASLLFYCSYGIYFILYMLFSSLVTYFGTILLHKTVLGYKAILSEAEKEKKKQLREELKKKKKRICFVTTITVLGIWIALKYANFIIHNFNLLLPEAKLPSMSWTVPLGISFYTLNLVSYLIDVYRNKYEPEKQYLRVLAYISFFPHIIQGPFNRYDDLGRQLKEEHRFSYQRLTEGMSRILWGYFKKLLIADKLGVIFGAINSSYAEQPMLYLLFATLLYGFYIYADFSGYMDIMCGISHLLGLKLAENFRQPYLAESVDEFWRRWHMTLGDWFKDYVFFSLSMSPAAYKVGNYCRKHWGDKAAKLIPGYIAMLFVWTATGLWHGADWKYVIWAYLNMLAIMYAMQFADTNQKWKERMHINDNSLVWKVFRIIRTYLFVSFFRIFSTSADVSAAVSYIRHLFSFFRFVPADLNGLFMGLKTSEAIAVLIGVIMLVIVDILKEKNLWQDVKVKCPLLIRNGILVFLIIMIILFAGGENDLIGGFLYEYF